MRKGLLWDAYIRLCSARPARHLDFLCSVAKKKVDALARFFGVAVRAGSGIGFHRGISVDIVHAALVGQT